MRTVQFICLLVAPAFVQVAAAGVWILEAGTDFRTGAPLVRKMRLEAGRASIEIQDAESHQTILYEASPKRVRMVDHKQRFFREFDAKGLATLEAQLSGAREELRRRADERLSRMTQEQRRAMEESMRKRVRGEAGARTPENGGGEMQFTQVWSGESVNEWTCDKYEGRVNGQKFWDVCAVPWNRLDSERAGFTILRDVVSYLRGLGLWRAGSLIEPGPADWKERKFYPGLPVQRIRYQNDRPVELLEIREIEQREFSDSDFEVPSDYMERAVLLLAPGETP